MTTPSSRMKPASQVSQDETKETAPIASLHISDVNPTAATTRSTSLPTVPDLDVLPHITTWLVQSAPKIQQFWIGATWRLWARYDLYTHLETALSSSALIYHGIDELWSPAHEEPVDIHIEPTDSSVPQIAIVLRCENVNENAGSFERFRAQMDQDIEKLKLLGPVGPAFEGVRLLMVGISGPIVAENDDTIWKCSPSPILTEVERGEINLWVYAFES